MTDNTDIVIAHLKHKGWEYPKDFHADNLTYLVWYMVFDCAQQIFDELRELPWKHLPKKMMKFAAEGFDEVDKNFWIGFNTEQTKFFIDKLNDFQEFISHSLTILKIQIMEGINHRPIEQQDVIAKIWLVSLLAHEANQIHSTFYTYAVKRKRGGTLKGHVSIAALEKIDAWMEKLLAYYIDTKREVNPKRADKMTSAATALSYKIFAWVKKDGEQEAEQRGATQDEIETLKKHFNN